MLELTILRKHAYQIGMNGRQEKVFEHLCLAELEGGYQGKFTNQKYRQKAKIQENKTAQRDFNDLVTKEILLKSGELKATHYLLNLSGSLSQRVRALS